jgi:hypothetical protein
LIFQRIRHPGPYDFSLAKSRNPAKRILKQAERAGQREENKWEIPFSGGLYKIYKFRSRRKGKGILALAVLALHTGQAIMPVAGPPG